MFEWLTERTLPSQADFCKLGGTQRASPVYVNCMFDRYFASNCADSLKGYKNARNMDDVRSRSNCQLPVPEKDIRSPNIVSSYNNFFYSTKICWIPNHEIVSPGISQDFERFKAWFPWTISPQIELYIQENHKTKLEITKVIALFRSNQQSDWDWYWM